MEGWVKLYRKFTEWEWFDNSNMVHLFIYLLLNANHEDNEWRGIIIKRGQIITGLNSLKLKTKISIRTLRTCLTRLKNTKEIDIQTTNKYSIITVCNYESYQSVKLNSDKHSDKQLTNNRQTTDNKQEYKNDNNVKNEELKTRTQTFKDSILVFNSQYSEVMLLAFFDYWSELNKSKTKMRFELEKVFEISKRLATWQRNDDKFKKQDNGLNRQHSGRHEKNVNAMWD